MAPSLYAPGIFRRSELLRRDRPDRRGEPLEQPRRQPRPLPVQRDGDPSFRWQFDQPPGGK